jgi:tetratricopeptide (TPR) repeat protein
MFGKNKLFKSKPKVTNLEPKNQATLSSLSDSSDIQKEGNVEKIDTRTYNNMVLEKLAAQTQKEDQTQIRAGAKAYAAKQYDEAIAHYEKALVINPADGSAYNNIGNVYLRGKNDPEKALEYYIQATTIQPSFNYGWLNLAICQKALGDIENAKKTISDALNILKNDDNLYGVLLQFQSELNQ